MGPNVDKMFLEVAGRPVVQHTWMRFDACPVIDHLVIVMRRDMKPEFEKLAHSTARRTPFTFVEGGAERQDSVWNGLEAVPRGTEIVAVQDAARPCTTHELITATVDAAREAGAAVAASRVVDTIKESIDGRTISTHLDRARLWAVQTPQTFRLEVIRRAITAAREAGRVFTDDTAACEAIGQPVLLVAGSFPNPKVTTPEDLPIVAELLERLIK